MTVEARVTQKGWHPPAAGFGEAALYIWLGTASLAYLKGFFEEWGKGDAQGLREAIIELAKRGRKSPTSTGRTFMPCEMRLGRIRFYFREIRSDEDFVEQINAAQEFVQSLPDVAFEGSAGPGEYGMFYGRKNKSWEGSIFEFTEFKHLPPGFWEE
jgi:hypothetical protein